MSPLVSTFALHICSWRAWRHTSSATLQVMLCWGNCHRTWWFYGMGARCRLEQLNAVLAAPLCLLKVTKTTGASKATKVATPHSALKPRAREHEPQPSLKSQTRQTTAAKTLDGARMELENGAKKHQKHTTPGIRWSSPTQLLVWRLAAYLGESGRDPEFSTISGRM